MKSDLMVGGFYCWLVEVFVLFGGFDVKFCVEVKCVVMLEVVVVGFFECGCVNVVDEVGGVDWE